MADLVPRDQIEGIVGARRHRTAHLARAVSSEEMVYILHSGECLETGRDLRVCKFSVALDRGIDADAWAGCEDAPMIVGIEDGELVPLAGAVPTREVSS